MEALFAMAMLHPVGKEGDRHFLMVIKCLLREHKPVPLLSLPHAGDCVTGIGLGQTIVFIAYADLSIFRAYGLGQSNPETTFFDNLLLCGVLLLTLLIAVVMHPLRVQRSASFR